MKSIHFKQCEVLIMERTVIINKKQNPNAKYNYQLNWECRGKDYPCYKDKTKMSISMSEKARQSWFSDTEIAQWKQENPQGETQGSLP